MIYMMYMTCMMGVASTDLMMHIMYMACTGPDVHDAHDVHRT